MIKNITITLLTITLLVGTLYHYTTVNTLQDKYDKTCDYSVRKSNRISELTKELKKTYDYQIWLHEHSTPVVIGESDICPDCGFARWSDSWCEHHMSR